MQFQFTQTLTDFIAFNWYFVWENPKRARNRFISMYLPLIASVLLVSVRRAGLSGWEVADFVLIALGIVFTLLAKPILYKLNKSRITKIVQKSPEGSILGDRTIQISEEGIEIEGETVHAKFEWSQFIQLSTTKDYMFLFISENQGLIFPLAVLSSEIQAEIKSHIQ